MMATFLRLLRGNLFGSAYDDQIYVSNASYRFVRIYLGDGNDSISSSLQYLSVLGGAGNDTVLGTDVDGGSGNDSINGISGDASNYLNGNSGNDIIVGASTYKNILHGDSGNDSLSANIETTYGNSLYGGSGNDTLVGSASNDILWGDTWDWSDDHDAFSDYYHSDYVVNEGGVDEINTGGGDDFVSAGAYGDNIALGSGQKAVHYGDWSDFGDTVTGFRDDDVIVLEDIFEPNPDGLPAQNLLVKFVAQGANTVVMVSPEGDGTFQTVALLTGVSASELSVTDNILFYNSQTHYVSGYDGAYGGALSEYVSIETAGYAYGGGGFDTITGSSEADILEGGTGRDFLYGGNGNDKVEGETGDDVLTGGAGNDIFIFTSVTESGTTAIATDVVTDFVSGQDKINLRAVDAFASSSRNDNFVWNGTAAFNSTSKGEVRYEKFDNRGSTNDYTMVWIDNDRDTGVEMAIRLTGLYNLSTSDFIL